MPITKPQLPPKAGYVEVEYNGKRAYKNIATGEILGAPKSLDVVKEEQKAQLSAICESTIESGKDIQLSETVTEHFNYDEKDQINIKEMFDAVMLGVTSYPYQSDDGGCRIYTAQEITTIYTELTSKKTATLTYYHSLCDMIDDAETEEAVEAVVWGTELTGEYLNHYNEMVAAASEQLSGLLTKLNA